MYTKIGDRNKKISRRKSSKQLKTDKENGDRQFVVEESEVTLKSLDAIVIPRREVDKHLTNIREILINTNATPIRCHGGKGYACSFCVEQYHNPADLKRHTRVKHDDSEKLDFMKGKEMHGYFVKLDITALQCKLCDEKISTLENVMEHLQEIHKKCLFMDIKNHILPFKFDSESLTCCICCNVFNSFKALLEHVNVHYRNFICEVCNAGFVNKNILLRHGDAHKTGTFTCTDCSKVFDTARKKKLHVRAKHGRDLPHKCGYCTERFKEIWAKKNHMMRVHNIKGPGVNCKACDKHFATKQGWRLHTARVHLMQKHYKCNECEMEFHTKKELMIHVVKHTGAREFRCDVCFKAYGRHKTLKEHIRRIHP